MYAYWTDTEQGEHADMPEEKKIDIDSGSGREADAADNGIDEHTASTAADESAAAERDRLEAMENERREMHERYLRAAAELENVKKRSQREMESFRKFANEAILKDLLGVVDNLERAVDSAKTEEGRRQLVNGVELILKDLLKIFKKFNVEPIAALNRPFDPNFHEAVMTEPSDDQPDRTVLRELQKGYTLSDRLLRPAMVVVSRKTQPADNATDDEGSQKDHP